MIRKLRQVKSGKRTFTTKGTVNVKALRVKHVGGVRKRGILLEQEEIWYEVRSERWLGDGLHRVC